MSVREITDSSTRASHGDTPRATQLPSDLDIKVIAVASAPMTMNLAFHQPLPPAAPFTPMTMNPAFHQPLSPAANEKRGNPTLPSETPAGQTQATFWAKRSVKIAIIVGTVALVVAIAACIFFIPGAPAAVLGAALVAATLGKVVGLSAISAKVLVASGCVVIPTLLAAAVGNKFVLHPVVELQPMKSSAAPCLTARSNPSSKRTRTGVVDEKLARFQENTKIRDSLDGLIKSRPKITMKMTDCERSFGKVNDTCVSFKDSDVMGLLKQEMARGQVVFLNGKEVPKSAPVEHLEKLGLSREKIQLICQFSQQALYTDGMQAFLADHPKDFIPIDKDRGSEHSKREINIILSEDGHVNIESKATFIIKDEKSASHIENEVTGTEITVNFKASTKTGELSIEPDLKSLQSSTYVLSVESENGDAGPSGTTGEPSSPVSVSSTQSEEDKITSFNATMQRGEGVSMFLGDAQAIPNPKEKESFTALQKDFNLTREEALWVAEKVEGLVLSADGIDLWWEKHFQRNLEIIPTGIANAPQEYHVRKSVEGVLSLEFTFHVKAYKFSKVYAHEVLRENQLMVTAIKGKPELQVVELK